MNSEEIHGLTTLVASVHNTNIIHPRNYTNKMHQYTNKLDQDGSIMITVYAEAEKQTMTTSGVGGP
jgi:hypothetical protein